MEIFFICLLAVQVVVAAILLRNLDAGRFTGEREAEIRRDGEKAAREEGGWDAMFDELYGEGQSGESGMISENERLISAEERMIGEIIDEKDRRIVEIIDEKDRRLREALDEKDRRLHEVFTARKGRIREILKILEMMSPAERERELAAMMTRFPRTAREIAGDMDRIRLL